MYNVSFTQNLQATSLFPLHYMANKVKHSFNALLKVQSIKSRGFSFIRLCGNVVYRVKKSYVDKLVSQNPLHFNLLSTSPEFFIDQNQFLFEVSYTVSQNFMTWNLLAVRQEVNNLESSVVVQELDFAINLALYGLL